MRPAERPAARDGRAQPALERPPEPSLRFPPFAACPPWWGGDLQTLRNALRGRIPRPHGRPSERLLLPARDGSGDILVGTLDRPAGDAAARPLVVLLHGLTGCEDSAYMLASAALLVGLGHPVLRLNLRGAGPSQNLCRLRYHSGRSDDLRAALAGLPAALTEAGLLLAGYSLGGNVLLKYLGEAPVDAPVLAAASISAPIDLAAASRRLMAPRNWLYHRWLLRRMKRESLAVEDLDAAERRTIATVRSVYAFDDRVVAPRNGFAGADDYYARCMARQFMAAIRVPTLVIHAADDPWVPIAPYRSFDWSANPNLVPLLAAGGGHVGFHDRASRTAWHDRCMAVFFGRRPGR